MRIRLILLLACVLSLLAACGKEPDVNLQQAPGLDESKAERDAALRDAFKNAPTDNPASEAVTRDIQAMFDRFTRAAHAHDARAALRHFNFDHMLSVTLQMADETVGRSERKQILDDTYENARKNWFDPEYSAFDWLESTVMRVQVSEDGKLALVYARHLMDEYGNLEKIRWWVALTDQGWQIYDWENFNTGYRSTSDWARDIQFAVSGREPLWSRGRDYISEGGQKMDEGEFEQAIKILKNGARVGYPPDLEVLRLQFLSNCYDHTSEHELGLKAAEQALKLNKDAPEPHFYRGRALYGLGRYEEAAKEYRWYLDYLGSDPIALADLGDALAWLDKKDEAVEAYRASLNDIPLPRALTGLAYYLEEDEYDELGEWFKKLTSPDQYYEYVVSELYSYIESNRPTEVINEVYREINPDDPQLAWYSAMVALDAEEYERAAELLKPAIPHAPLDETEMFQQRYWYARLMDGKALETLEEAGNRQATFVYLADTAEHQSKGELLNELCEAWREGHEDNQRLHYYLGRADSILEDYAAAEPHFREGWKLSKHGDDYNRPLFHGLLDAMRVQGKSMEAFEEFRQAADAFAHLAQGLFDAEKTEEFEPLLNAYVEKWPQRHDVPRFKGDLAWLKEDWKTAGQEYDRYLEDHFDIQQAEWAVLERCVRALIRAKEYPRARTRAEKGLGEPNAWLQVIVHAAFGNVDQTGRKVDEYLALFDDPEGGKQWIAELYWDEDCGEPLRSDKFKDLHKRIPIPPKPGKEPAEEEEAGDEEKPEEAELPEDG